MARTDMFVILLIAYAAGVAAAAASVEVDAQGTAAAVRTPAERERFSVATMNPSVVNARYAVRGALLARAMALEKEGHAIIRCNIGNPQALGQHPISFARQVLSLVLNPELVDAMAGGPAAGGGSLADKRRAAAAKLLYPADVVARAQAYLGAVPSVGAYSDSQGVPLVRREVAAFIAARDGGHAASPDDVFLTDGASAGVKYWMQAAIRGPQDAVLVPIPQYPLYSAVTTLFNGTLAPYYLDEGAGWEVHLAELERALAASRADGRNVRALVVINPGNPTGQCLGEEAMRAIVAFCRREGLVLMADEVYQENIYRPDRQFTSFKKVLRDLEADEAEAAAGGGNLPPVPLVSFHSISKGFTGECGLRGGYFETANVPEEIKAQILKIASVSLCSSVPGQLAVGLMVNPPRAGDASFAAYDGERRAILDSLRRRATKLHAALNRLEGVSCQPLQGAMYAFPSITLPPKAIAAAAAAGVAPDFLYALRLLEEEHILVVPGSGFKQREHSWHFRTTFLPPEEQIDAVVEKLAAFHARFLEKYK